MGKTAALPSADSLFGAPRPKPVAAPPAPVPPPAPEGSPDFKKVEPPKPHLQVIPSAPPLVRKTSAEVDAREKFTFRFDTATLSELDCVWMQLRQMTGKKIRKSWIVEAFVRQGMRDSQKALEILKAEMHVQMGEE